MNRANELPVPHGAMFRAELAFVRVGAKARFVIVEFPEHSVGAFVAKLQEQDQGVF